MLSYDYTAPCSSDGMFCTEGIEMGRSRRQVLEGSVFFLVLLDRTINSIEHRFGIWERASTRKHTCNVLGLVFGKHCCDATMRQSYTKQRSMSRISIAILKGVTRESKCWVTGMEYLAIDWIDKALIQLHKPRFFQEGEFVTVARAEDQDVNVLEDTSSLQKRMRQSGAACYCQ